jgi:hypothetical protein
MRSASGMSAGHTVRWRHRLTNSEGRQKINETVKTIRRVGAVGAVTGAWAGCGGTLVRYLATKRDISLLQRGQTGDGAHPAPYWVPTGRSFIGGKAAEV